MPSGIREPPQGRARAQKAHGREGEDSEVKACEWKATNRAAAAAAPSAPSRRRARAAGGAAAAAGSRDLLVYRLVLGVAGRRASGLRQGSRRGRERKHGERQCQPSRPVPWTLGSMYIQHMRLTLLPNVVALRPRFPASEDAPTLEAQP